MLLMLCLSACEQEKKTTPENFMELRKKEPLSETYKLRYMYTDSGLVRMKLNAGRAREYLADNAQQTEYLLADQGVVIEFYEGQGVQKSRLTSNIAYMYEQKGLAEARGNVVVINNRGDRLETEQLFWFKHRKQLATGGFVKITTPKEIVFGDSLISNQDFTKYKIYKLRGTLKVDD
jgi:LPS export ABC transporter protein LptC